MAAINLSTADQNVSLRGPVPLNGAASSFARRPHAQKVRSSAYSTYFILWFQNRIIPFTHS
jgi:hypothetical protein